MQSHNPAPHWPPWMAAPQPLQDGQYHSWNAYGTPLFFSLGSPLGAHATPTLQLSDPTACSDATGSMYYAVSHPYTRSVTTFPPGPLQTPPSHNAAATSTHKSRAARAGGEVAYPTMAIEQHRVQPSNPPATQSHSRPPSIEELRIPREHEVVEECPATPPTQEQPTERSKSNEKKMHPCWMCHKSFDRPSTLRKHLLVHTGHKAYACDTCGRRFGVLSNLNRHAKKCAQRPVNQGASAPAEAPGPSAGGTAYAEVAAATEIAPEAGPSTAPTTVSTTAAALRTPDAPAEQARGRKRKAVQPMEGSAEDQAAELSRKERRPRRKKSPTRWVPDSLKLYNLTPNNKATPIPLPPVRPFVDSNGKVLEERDSYSLDTHDTPYHPRGWMGRLPGPGLMDTGGSAASSGRLLIF